jgi:N-acetylglucosaminyldiphosphoundecaprenol N-acetyl-beta-D-mannosaminyltransferase
MTEHKNGRQSRAEAIESLYQRYSRRGLWGQKTRRLLRTLIWLAVIQPMMAAKRIIDVCFALALLFALSPLLTLGALLSGFTLRRTPKVGRWCTHYNELNFETEGTWGGKILRLLHLQSLPKLLNILRGDMSFVGPRPVSPGELNPREWAVRKRANVRPGLISLWWIRKRANIDYGTELEADGEYVDRHGLREDLGISLRAIPAVLYGQGVSSAPERVELLGIPLTNLTMAEALETIVARLDGHKPNQICFVNADCANIAYRNRPYLDVLQHADLCLADGIGIKIAGKLLAQEIRQNVNGTDLFPRLCEALTQSDQGLFLLGARPGVAETVARWIGERHPGVKVCGFQHGYYQPEDDPGVIENIRNSGADLLLVAFGVPRQDLWINQHLEETAVKVAMGVGGLFDFYSGRISRAPLWLREIGMEWIYRLFQEPGRLWKRYLVGNGLFLLRVLWERMTCRRSEDGSNGEEMQR